MIFAWFSPFVVVPLQSSGGVRVWQVEDPARLCSSFSALQSGWKNGEYKSIPA